MKKRVLFLTAGLITASFMYSSCSKEETTKTVTPTPSLYERVGGTTMVNDPANSGKMIEAGRLTLRAVVDSSIFVIAADPQMAKYFPVLFAELGMSNTSGLTALSKNFTDFMCTATGSKNSGYAYTGKSMKAAHDPAQHSRIAQKIDKADFDKFVGDIGTGLAQNGVTSANNKALVDDLVALLYTTQSDIVQK
ncbi:MAG: group I truncated hemoglobin [Bacteroidia bacterium]